MAIPLAGLTQHETERGRVAMYIGGDSDSASVASDHGRRRKRSPARSDEGDYRHEEDQRRRVIGSRLEVEQPRRGSGGPAPQAGRSSGRYSFEYRRGSGDVSEFRRSSGGDEHLPSSGRTSSRAMMSAKDKRRLLMDQMRACKTQDVPSSSAAAFGASDSVTRDMAERKRMLENTMRKIRAVNTFAKGASRDLSSDGEQPTPRSRRQVGFAEDFKFANASSSIESPGTPPRHYPRPLSKCNTAGSFDPRHLALANEAADLARQQQLRQHEEQLREQQRPFMRNATVANFQQPGGMMGNSSSLESDDGQLMALIGSRYRGLRRQSSDFNLSEKLRQANFNAAGLGFTPGRYGGLQQQAGPSPAGTTDSLSRGLTSIPERPRSTSPRDPHPPPAAAAAVNIHPKYGFAAGPGIGGRQATVVGGTAMDSLAVAATVGSPASTTPPHPRPILRSVMSVDPGATGGITYAGIPLTGASNAREQWTAMNRSLLNQSQQFRQSVVSRPGMTTIQANPADGGPFI